MGPGLTVAKSRMPWIEIFYGARWVEVMNDRDGMNGGPIRNIVYRKYYLELQLCSLQETNSALIVLAPHVCLASTSDEPFHQDQFYLRCSIYFYHI